ncbi:hypothetical protein PSA7680_01571 [Pseudoruegeria aquimaris]|uniref:Uncharacterized protein n=1 Tax=Pseudoruegeria aquimaris TaxID=393663 RepID=A0A1Y5SAW5_9RHOB|nr:hypothetical protein [Pseudoruegeria aquimaris]SLN33567.1 hypothetical protein PSA7680_01571 [Pseudoruegeria aquimaris]
MKKTLIIGTLCCGIAGLAGAAEQAAIDGCIDELRRVGGPDGQGGEVVSSEFSEAATRVTLKDRGGSVWSCLAYSDGTVEELRVVNAADDGGGAMAGAPAGAGETVTEAVRFASGTTGAELAGSLPPGASHRYTLGAKEGQFLYVRVAARGSALDFQIFNPDGSFLLEMIPSDTEYRGQLWQSGEHVVEVINRGNDTRGYNVIFGIE